MNKKPNQYTVEVQLSQKIPFRSKAEMISKYFTVNAHSTTQARNAVKRAGYSNIVNITKKESL